MMASYVTPKKNTAFIFYAGLVSQADTKLFKSAPTLAAGDFKVSIDGGALANLATLPTNTPGSQMVKFSLSSSEMNGDNITVVCSDAAGAEWCDAVFNIQTSARQVDDLAFPTTSGRGIAVDTNNKVPATIAAGDLANDSVTAAALKQDAITEIVNAIVVASLSGSINVGELGYTLSVAAAFAAAAATDTATLVGRLSSARAVYLDNLSAGAVAQASALATLAADVTAILADSNELQTDWVNGGRLDLLIDAIKAKTDGLPSDPADASNIAGSFATVNSTLSTISTNASTAASAATSAASSSASAASSASTAASAASTAVTQTTGAAIRSAIGLAAANLDTQFGLLATAANLATLAGKFTGITLLARWLGALMGKTADATTLTEIQATTAGAGYLNTTDSLEAIRDRGDAAWTTGGGGGGSTTIVVTPLQIVLTSGRVQQLDLEAHQFASLGSYEFTVTDYTGAAVDLSAKTVKLVAFDKTATPGAYLFLVTGTISGASSNIVTISQDNTNTQTARKVRYMLWNTTDNKVYAEGTINIKPSPSGVI